MEFVVTYHHAPAPEMPWLAFLLMVTRSSQAAAREVLQLMNATSLAIGSAFGDSSVPANVRRLESFAYPRSSRRPAFIQNQDSGTGE